LKGAVGRIITRGARSRTQCTLQAQVFCSELTDDRARLGASGVQAKRRAGWSPSNAPFVISAVARLSTL
jgi:hypothetical protein